VMRLRVSKRIDPGLHSGAAIPPTWIPRGRLGLAAETNAAHRAAFHATRPKGLVLVGTLAATTSALVLVFIPTVLLALPQLVAILVILVRWRSMARKWRIEHGDLARRQVEIARIQQISDRNLKIAQECRALGTPPAG